jgi:phosphomannomutase
MSIEDYFSGIDQIVKRDDIRGVYGENIDADFARRLGRSMARIFRGTTAVEPVNVAIGHDMRLSGPVLAQALAEGLAAGGCRPIQMGLAGTELAGFLPAHYSEVIDGGVIITASHNPADNNGFKFFGRKGQPLELAEKMDPPCPESFLQRMALSVKKSQIPPRLQWDEFAPDYIKTAVEKGALDFDKAAAGSPHPMRIAVEAGNGMGGRILGELAKITSVFEWTFSHANPDGRFPLMVPNPLNSKYQAVVAELVQKTDSDLGVCFDGDADRVAVADEHGDMIPPPLMAALIGRRLRDKLGPDTTIAHNLACSWAIADALGDRGDVTSGDAGTVITPVGYGKIKLIMNANREIAFVAEHSGHYMFREFYTADSGMLAGMIMLELAAELHAEGKSISSELEQMRGRYLESGEINFEMPADRPAEQVIGEAIEAFQNEAVRMYGVAEEGVSEVVREMDSYPPAFDQAVEDVRIEAEDWWFCMRKSGTEGTGGGVCRLYVEADGDRALLEEKRDALVDFIGGQYRID